MKKHLFLTLAAAAICAAICVSCNKEDKKLGSDEELTFESVVKEDFEYLKALKTKDLLVYEVECVLNGKLADTPADKLNIKTSTTIAVTSEDKVYFITTDFATGEKTVDVIDNRWGGSFSIDDPTAMEVTFKEAVKILKDQSALTLPASDKMTFRHPLGTAPNPLYIFGSGQAKPYIAVDAMTGAIGTMSAAALGLEE